MRKCTYNKMIDCGFCICDCCGWNPVVKERRVKAIRKWFDEQYRPVGEDEA